MRPEEGVHRAATAPRERRPPHCENAGAADRRVSTTFVSPSCSNNRQSTAAGRASAPEGSSAGVTRFQAATGEPARARRAAASARRTSSTVMPRRWSSGNCDHGAGAPGNVRRPRYPRPRLPSPGPAAQTTGDQEVGSVPCRSPGSSGGSVAQPSSVISPGRRGPRAVDATHLSSGWP